MRKTIETAPRNGVFVILEDASHGTFAVARWSGEATQWLDDDGKPIQFNATHWQSPQSLDSEAAPRRSAAPAQPSPVAAGGTTAKPPAATAPTRAAAPDRPVLLKRYRMATMAACLLVGAVSAPLLYRSDGGLQLPDWIGSDDDSGLKQALDLERARGVRLAADVATANEAADRSREAGERALAGLREALQVEQSRAEKLAGQLDEAQREGAAQSARTRETMNDAVKEKDRLVGELREALKAQEVQTAEVRRKIEAETVQAKQTGLFMAEALQQERDKVAELRLALTTTRRDAEVQAVAARSTGDEAARLREANARATDALREAQGRTEKLATELAAARHAAGLKEAAERTADEQRKALLQERDKTGKLTAALAETKSELQALTKARTAEEIVRDNQQAALRVELQKAKADAAGARDSLQMERLRAEQAEQLLIATQAAAQGQEYRSQAPAATAVPRYSTASLSTAGPQTSTPIGDTPQIPRSTTRSEVSIEEAGLHPVRLIARAHLLLDQGNIGAARNMLDRAAEMGSAEALFWLAETYDPLLLPARNALGTQGDVARARELYERALVSGVSEARLRLESLAK